MDSIYSKAHRLDNLFETWPDPILLIDQTGHIVCTNSLAKIFHDKLQTTPIKLSLRQIFRLTNAEVSNIITTCSASTSPINLSLTFKKYVRNGLREFKFHGWKHDEYVILRAPDFAPSIQSSEIIVSSAEAKLSKALREARDAINARDNFIHQISHEFRTPLNAIIGMSEMMTNKMFGELEPHYMSYAKDINSSGRTLLELIDEILRYKDHNPKSPAITDLSDCVHYALDAVATMAQNKGLSLQIHDEKHMPAIRADNLLLRRILVNLISNAIKYTPSGGKVEISPAQDSSDEFCLIVSDTGIGIRKRDLEHIFEPFFRAEDVYVRKEDGLGMGLALTKKAVEILGGHIDINSNFGHGTKVRVCFPSTVIQGNA